jgi:hypothetical protein
MKKIILHVGSGKTGSTSIQKSLYECKKVNDSAIFYPTLLNHKSSQIFRFAFCSVNDTPSNIKAKYGGEDRSQEYSIFQQQIKDSFKSQVEGHDNVVVSSEFLFLSTKDEVEQIKKFLHELGFEEIHVIMYLRDPAKYYLSVAQQSLKNQFTMPKPDGFRYNIRGAIENWESITPTSLTVKEFDRSCLQEGDVVKDFEGYLNSHSVNVALNLSSAKNETMSVEGTVILQEYHRLLDLDKNLDKDKIQEHKLRARRFSNISSQGTKPILKEDICKFVHKNYFESIVFLNRVYGIFDSLLVESETCSVVLTVPEYRLFTDIVDGFNINIYLDLINKI